MSAPVIVRSNHSDLFSSAALPALEELFRHQLSLQPSIREKLADVRTTQRDIWQASEVGDVQNFIEVPEGTDYTMVRPRQGLNKTLVPKKYGLGFSISEEAVEDGKFDFISDMVRKLAESAMESQEQSVIDIYNNAFGSADAWDGLDLCHAAHTLPSGLTFRNRLSSDADLSPSSLDTMLSDFNSQFLRDSGKIARIQPKILLVPEGLKRYAMEVVGSDLRADTPNNNMNSLKQEGLIVVSSPKLTDTDAWFLLAAPADLGVKIIKRKGIETKAAGPDAGFINDSIMYKSRYREIVGITHAYGVFGTTGA
jgi:phage major head subunit gpT-like protein